MRVNVSTVSVLYAKKAPSTQLFFPCISRGEGGTLPLLLVLVDTSETSKTVRLCYPVYVQPSHYSTHIKISSSARKNSVMYNVSPMYTAE